MLEGLRAHSQPTTSSPALRTAARGIARRDSLRSPGTLRGRALLGTFATYLVTADGYRYSFTIAMTGGGLMTHRAYTLSMRLLLEF